MPSRILSGVTGTKWSFHTLMRSEKPTMLKLSWGRRSCRMVKRASLVWKHRAQSPQALAWTTVSKMTMMHVLWGPHAAPCSATSFLGPGSCLHLTWNFSVLQDSALYHAGPCPQGRCPENTGGVSLYPKFWVGRTSSPCLRAGILRKAREVLQRLQGESKKAETSQSVALGDPGDRNPRCVTWKQELP